MIDRLAKQQSCQLADKIISEESSEKNKRGRPRKYPENMIREILAAGDVKTERGAREHLNMCLAFALIKNAWKADPPGTLGLNII